MSAPCGEAARGVEDTIAELRDFVGAPIVPAMVFG